MANLSMTQTYVTTHPPGAMPKDILLEPLTSQIFFFMSMVESEETILRVDGNYYLWRTDAEPCWLPTLGFGDTTLTSMVLLLGVFQVGASMYFIIIIDKSGRCLDSPVELVELHPPSILTSDGLIVFPWELNEQHLFICEGKLHFTQVFGVVACLFRVHKFMHLCLAICGEHQHVLCLSWGKSIVCIACSRSSGGPQLQYLIH
ncbi:hypothetical protein SEVIR_9G353801v4 [Setaria viridis]